jgi:DNA processing protein
VSFIQDTIKQTVEIPLSSALYPKEWKTLSDPPPVLYARGNTELLNERKFTIVGSRRTPAPALQAGKEIAKELSYAFVIVTGTADGGDSAAIEGALAGSGKVICVLAGGFSAIPQGNLSLLKQVEKRGLLLSVHPLETPVREFSYEHRNKLLARLGEGTLVLGAAEKSGALITARYAWKEKKPVFAIPYFPGSSAGAGCNAILKAGGILTETAKDIAKAFEIELKAQTKLSLTSDEEKMLTALQTLGEAHAEELSKASGIPLFKTRAVLSALEVKGACVALGGNRYAVI